MGLHLRHTVGGELIPFTLALGGHTKDNPLQKAHLLQGTCKAPGKMGQEQDFYGMWHVAPKQGWHQVIEILVKGGNLHAKSYQSGNSKCYTKLRHSLTDRAYEQKSRSWLLLVLKDMFG